MTYYLDLAVYGNRGILAFVGRQRGKTVRDASHLVSEERTNEQIVVRVPEDLMAVTSSFVLGLFGDSIQTLGREGFRAKYDFQGKDISAVVNEAIEQALSTSSPLSSATP